MSKNRVARNLRKPKGKLGKEIGEQLVLNLSIYKQFEELLDLSLFKDILEIGYGPGFGINYYIEKYSIHIDGIDYSRLMHRFAADKNEKNIKEGKVHLERADINKWSTNKTYDLIYFFNVIYFFNNLEKIFKKINSLLNRNGCIGIFMDSPEILACNPITIKSVFNRYTIEQVKSELKRIGCTKTNVIEHNEYKGSYYLLGFS
jgi:SAM-dependent methyltransferase